MLSVSSVAFRKSRLWLHEFKCCQECCQNLILSKAKGLESLDSSPSWPVRAGGVEPPRAYTHCHLKTARLPFRPARRQSTNLHQNLCNLKSACRAAIFRRKIQAARREEGGSPVGFRTTEPSLIPPFSVGKFKRRDALCVRFWRFGHPASVFRLLTCPFLQNRTHLVTSLRTRRRVRARHA